MFELYCKACRKIASGKINGLCECGGFLDTRYHNPTFVTAPSKNMWKFREQLPIESHVAPVTLGEGGTPLHLSKLSDSHKLFFKDESQNPTGSVKDRALSLAVTKAKELGIERATLFSAGSTGLAAAAYAARGNLDLTVFVGSATPSWRYLQMQVLGAKVIKVDAGSDGLMNILEETANEQGVYQLTTCRRANPFQAEAPKTIAYEIAEELDDVPDWVILPIGGGGTLSGIWKGFQELYAFGLVSRLPRLLGVQVEGYDTLALAFERGLRDEHKVAALLEGTPEIDTCCTKLTHKFPHDSMEALAAIDSSRGAIYSLSDQEALQAMLMVGQTDGLFIEPSSALAVAGYLRAKQDGLIDPDATAVCILTGAAFRELPLLTGLLRLDGVKTVLPNKEALSLELRLPRK